MTDNEPELIVLLKKLRYDLTDMQGKVGEALRMAGTLNHPEAKERLCGHCGLTFRHVLGLQEHLYISHNGPLPEAWARAEALADEPAEVQA